MFNRSVFFLITILILSLIGTVGTSIAAPDSIDPVPLNAPAGPITLSAPTGLASDSFGNLYIADTGNNRVVMTDATGLPLLVIGTGIAGFTPTAGYTGLNTTLAATAVQLNAPQGVAVDASGNVYIADTGNHRIHMIKAGATKLISSISAIVTVAGNGIARYSGDTTPPSSAITASLKSPTGVAVDSSLNIYIADNGNYRIRKVDATSKNITPFAGDGNATTLTPYNMTFSPAGDLYIADSGNNRILKSAATKGVLALPLITVAGTGTTGYSGDGGLATKAMLNQPSGVATDGNDLYISDTMNNCVRKVSLSTTNNVISTRAGNAAQAAIKTALDFLPVGIALDSAGDVYVADSSSLSNQIEIIHVGISAITTASPPGGTYNTTQVVSLTASKAAIIKYQINSGIVTTYTGPISIAGPGATTLTFYSIDTAGHQEVKNTATYIFATTAPTTTASINATPVNGTTTYYSAQPSLSITLTSSDPLSTIYYTTTGTTPTTSSPVYTTPISIPLTSTPATVKVQFFGVDAVGNKELVQSKTYSVVAINTTASPVGATYTIAKNITLVSNDMTASIYYTVDGSDPVFPFGVSTTALYTATIPIATNTILKFRAIDKDGIPEQVRTQAYTIDSTPPITTASPAGSVIPYSTAQTVTLTSNDQTAVIYYTISGVIPTTASTKYTVPIYINKTTTLMYFGADLAGNQESLNTQVYTIDTTVPKSTASVLTGTYAYIQPVTLSSTDQKATIYFTTDGTVPTTSSAKYTTPIIINKSTILKYFAVNLAGTSEPVNEQDYTYITLLTTASPKGGMFTSIQTVTLAANGAGAKIYYTVDGSQPTTASPTYSAPILMTNDTTTLQFFQVDSFGMTESVKSEIYVVDSVAPSTIATCGKILNTMKLTAIDSSDPMPKIEYIANTTTTFTKNGILVTVPAYTITDYIGLIRFTNNTIVKFFSADAAGNVEQLKTAYCPVVELPLDANPSLYLETLPDNSTTSNNFLLIHGNIAPFGTTVLDINSVVVPTDTTDGSFSYKLSPLVSGIITTRAVNGVSTNIDARTINYATSPALTTTSLTIGTGNSVIGNDVRVPITFTSGYQAAAVSVDIAYNPATSRLSNPRVVIGKETAALGKIISGGNSSPGVYRILIMDSPGGKAIKAMPDGVVAYLSFSALYSAAVGNEPLSIVSYSVTDSDANTMSVNTGENGAVNVVSKPGSKGTPEKPVNLKGVMDALYMLLDLDPAAHPVDCSVDMNADGIVQINELQRVINSFVGM